MATSIDTSYTDQPLSPADIYRARLEKRVYLEKDGKPAEVPADPLAKDEKGFRVTISEEALKKAGFLKEAQKTSGGEGPSGDAVAREIEELKRLDGEVRAREQAQILAGGSLVRGATRFTYKTGPDGKLYAVSGEVSIDTNPVDGDPQATVRKMRQVQKAALASAPPSGQDRAVAAAAVSAEMVARRQLSHQQTEKG